MITPIKIDIPSFLPNHPWHPSVVYVPEGWSGHPYWMAETPFPPFHVAPYKDRWELPCIHFSDDGINWKSIASNPIDDLSEPQIKGHGYHSDPHLIFNDGVLYCYYRLMEDHDVWTTIIRKHSIDGIHWSGREIVCRTKSAEQQIISPSVVWTGACFRMYYVDDTFTNINRGVQYRDSVDGLNFGSPMQVELVPTYSNESAMPWHIDVQKICGAYHMLIHDVDHNLLAYCTSEDGKSFDYQKVILCASHKWTDFFSHKLYRACLIETENQLRIYFSANNGMASYIGMMESCQDGTFCVHDCRVGKSKFFFVVHFIWLRCMQFMQRCVHFIEKRL